MYGLKIDTQSYITKYELPNEKENYIALQKSIDCDFIDIVHAKNLPEPYCLVVDDEALLKEKPTINLLASWLYGMLEHGQPICGDVIIMKDKVTDDGIKTVGLEQKDFEKVGEVLFNINTVKEVQSLDELIRQKFKTKEDENENS